MGIYLLPSSWATIFGSQLWRLVSCGLHADKPFVLVNALSFLPYFENSSPALILGSAQINSLLCNVQSPFSKWQEVIPVGKRKRTQCRTPSCADCGDICHFERDLPWIFFNPNPCLARISVVQMGSHPVSDAFLFFFLVSCPPIVRLL